MKIFVEDLEKGVTGCRKSELPKGCKQVGVLHSSERFTMVERNQEVWGAPRDCVRNNIPSERNQGADAAAGNRHPWRGWSRDGNNSLTRRARMEASSIEYVEEGDWYCVERSTCTLAGLSIHFPKKILTLQV